MRALFWIAVAACAADEPPPTTAERNFCGSTSTELTIDAASRYQPVGFLNNGCTAFAIDAEHVAAAAHCFVDGTTGMFQPSLRFYPNYHPDRAWGPEAEVPVAILDRAVVGSRVGRLYPHSDWGIAHVAEWRHVDPSTLAFATLDRAVTNFPVGSAAFPVEHVAYNRGKFPVTGPDMMFDNGPLCDWAPQWARVPAPWAPPGERFGCNQRWMSGTIYSDCELEGVVEDVIQHRCEVWGGSSGAPLLLDRPEGPTVVGLTSGGPVLMREVALNAACAIDEECGPIDSGAYCRDSRCYRQVSNEAAPNAACVEGDELPGRHNGGPATSRFVDAPRFASNVAVARRPDGTAATAVFGIDADLDQVVMRERLGERPNHDAAFGYWKPLPAISEHQLSNIAACSDRDGHPMVVVTAQQGPHARLLRTRFDPNLGAWLPWQAMELPGPTSSAVDVDAAYDDDGSCLLFALDAAAKAIVSTNLSNADWSDPVKWRTIATKLPITGSRLSALRDDAGFLWLATLDDAGALHVFAKTCNDRTQVWFHYPVQSRLGITRWRDVDLHWSDGHEGRLVAIPDGADTAALVEFALPKRTCWSYSNPDGTAAGPSDEVALPVELWTPDTTVRTRPDLATVTASRWLEDPRGMVSPNIFATDRQGNVYVISNTAGRGWSYEWQSFYHEKLVQP